MQIPGTVGSYGTVVTRYLGTIVIWIGQNVRNHPRAHAVSEPRPKKMKLEVKKSVPNSGKLDAFLTSGGLN
jgi:hypothetical protein